MSLKNILKLFKDGNVCVTGLRGTGKDVLFGNVIYRLFTKKHIPYISNLDYGGYYIPLVLKDLNINNSYDNFINNKTNDYIYPYNLGSDIFLSDAGVYLPSQYCSQLNKQFEGLIGFQALSRQIALCNFHINVQNLNRVWDKVREQSDIYIRCLKCKFLFGFVFQKVIIYDSYESCLNRVKPCRIHVPLFGNKVAKMNARLYIDNFYNSHGSIKQKLLIYKNKSKHDSLYFGHLLGVHNEEI